MIDNHVGVLLKIINITSLCKAKFPYYAVKYEQTIFFGFSLFIYMAITILVALFCWGIRLLGNFEHRFRDLCTAGALSGPREELAILLLKRGIDNLIIVLKCSCTFRAERGIGNFNAKT